MHSKQSRGWDRASPGRRRLGVERGKIEHFHRRDTGSPDRTKRGRWESPPRNHTDSPVGMRRRDFESPSRAGRLSSPKSRRGGFDDGPNPSSIERRRPEEEYHLRPMHQDVHREAQDPAGLVFLCSSSTLRECFHFRVFGLPAAQREVVERVVPGTKLFLFNFDTKELFGVFEAASHGGLNLVPEAFLESKEIYAAQVRFSIFRECLPLADDIVKDVLRENFSQRGKFDCELSSDQVREIMKLFSRQEMRPGGLGQERERVGQDSGNISLGVNGLDREGRRFSSLEPQLLMSGSLVDSGPLPDPAVILGQGMIEEVDQLAFKYLQNNPEIAGLRLDPVNTSLLSSSLRKSSHDQGGFAAVNLQLNGSHIGMPFIAGPNPLLLGHPGSSVPDSANPGADGGKTFGPFVPGLLAGGGRGLLSIPPMHHHIPGMPPVNQLGFPTGMPNQPGMIRPFPPGGPFPMPIGGAPDFGGVHMPFHPLQGPHGIPPHLGNPRQLGNSPQAVNRANNRQMPNSKVGNKSKKNKQKKGPKQQKGAGSEKDDKKDDGAKAEVVESAEV